MRLALLACLWMAAAPAQAAVLSTFDFAGICQDCIGTATAELTLQDYSLGDPITLSNFITFNYDGTDLQPGYRITAGQASAVSGSMRRSQGPEDFFVVGNGEIFSTTTDGSWCVGTACLNDYGFSHGFSIVSADAGTSTVAEPIGLVVLGAPLVAIAGLRRLQRRQDATRLT